MSEIDHDVGAQFAPLVAGIMGEWKINGANGRSNVDVDMFGLFINRYFTKIYPSRIVWCTLLIVHIVIILVGEPDVRTHRPVLVVIAVVQPTDMVEKLSYL